MKRISISLCLVCLLFALPFTLNTFVVNAQGIEATVDFKPETLNLNSRGKVVTVFIELPEGYDVGDIDVSSILLNNTVPALPRPVSVGDEDGDGTPDLMVKFSRSEVIALFPGRGEYKIEITGTVNDAPFVGNDTVRVIGK